MCDEPLSKHASIADAFNELVDIVHRLRAPDGCPWDRKQTPESLKQYIVEEAYEVTDAIDSGSAAALTEELGDLLLQVALQAEIAEEHGRFGIVDVIRAISTKLVHRHPHVFGETSVAGADEVVANWEKIKQAEKATRGLLDGLPRHLPALQMASRIGEKAKRVGFDWPDTTSVRDKINEELAETDEAIALGDKEAIADEIGDLLFSVAQWARHVGVEPEETLRRCCARFKERFSFMENRVKTQGVVLEELHADALEALWQEAKGR